MFLMIKNPFVFSSTPTSAIIYDAYTKICFRNIIISMDSKPGFKAIKAINLELILVASKLVSYPKYWFVRN